MATTMTFEEADRRLALRQAKDIHTIRNVVVFFFWLWVIGVVLAVASIGVASLGDSADTRFERIENEL